MWRNWQAHNVGIVMMWMTQLVFRVSIRIAVHHVDTLEWCPDFSQLQITDLITSIHNRSTYREGSGQEITIILSIRPIFFAKAGLRAWVYEPHPAWTGTRVKIHTAQTSAGCWYQSEHRVFSLGRGPDLYVHTNQSWSYWKNRESFKM